MARGHITREKISKRATPKYCSCLVLASSFLVRPPSSFFSILPVLARPVKTGKRKVGFLKGHCPMDLLKRDTYWSVSFNEYAVMVPSCIVVRIKGPSIGEFVSPRAVRARPDVKI